MKNLICLPAILLLFCAFTASETFAQQRVLSGKVIEYQTNEPLPGANVTLLSPADSSLVRGVTSTQAGTFMMDRLEPGNYLLAVSFVGYLRFFEPIDLTESGIENLEIRLDEDRIQLRDVRITALAPRMEVRGDTTAFNADAYRVNPDASAEDLVRRMPGFQIENGRLQAQGEEVRRVTVDGNEFFGDDATAALRNLPAEIIQEIEVFDRLGDQARFTGFNDGNTERAINIRTRQGMNNGRFGRVNTGYGTDNRYMGGGNANFFDGARRISVVGLTNNMNQLNFSGEDLAGVAQGSGGGGRSGPMMRGGGGGRGGGPGGWGGGGNVRDFMMGGQSGVSSVHSLGLNYIDRWNESWNVNASYFFNATDNTNDESLERLYLSGTEVDQFYDETTFSRSDLYNHRVNARLEYTIDEFNSLIITPRLQFRQNNSTREMQAFTMSPDIGLLNETDSFYRTNDFSYDIANSVLYRRRFEQRGRTLSVNLRTDFNDRTGDQLQFGESVFYGDFGRDLQNDQNTEINSGGYTLSTDFQYTEPLSENRQLIFSYNPTYNRSISDRDAFTRDQPDGDYTVLDPAITSRFDNHVYTHNVGSGYRYSAENYNFNVNLAYQYTLLNGEQSLPLPVETRRNYHNVLPRAMFMYRFSQSTNIRLMYNTNTRTPSANQLQDVIDNTNPLQLSGGNPDLDQQYNHSLSARFRSANVERGTSIMGFVSAGYTTDHIGNTTFTAGQDTVLAEGIVLGRGARFTRPENTGNAWNVRSFFNYGMPFGLISSNINFFSGVSYSTTPTIVNNISGDNRNLAMSGGMSVNSNISERVDFSLSYRGTYNIVDNSLRPELDNNYYMGRIGARMNLLPWGRLVISSELNAAHYSGLSDDFNLDTWYWNASLGYKFLSNKAAEVRFTVVDILAQNNNVNRIIEDNYIEDVRSDVLSRFFMMTLTYNFRSFSGR